MLKVSPKVLGSRDVIANESYSLEIQLGLLHHTSIYTFGFLWPFGIGSSNFYVTSKSDNEKNFEVWFFLAHANFKSTFWVCARDALMQCCRINLICQFSSDAAAGQKVVQMDQ